MIKDWNKSMTLNNMNEPWNLRTVETREADTLPLFIIFCEDKVSEPIYFKYFETSLIKVNLIGDQKSKLENVNKAISDCIEKGFMEHGNGVYKLKVENTQIWCVFDRDVDNKKKNQVESNTSFTHSIKMADDSGLKVAWSNDAFELWILLHFEDVDATIDENKNRKTYYNRLTDIFRNLPNPNEDLIKALAYHGFSYKGTLKSENNFRNIVRNEIVGKTNEAIARAKTLMLKYESNPPKPHHEKSPCTMVYLLVEELLRLGKKDI
jgi:hypothetical protein